jgi:hypothetical protein
MATLLSKFRIEYSSMTVVPDIGKKPTANRLLDRFQKLIHCKQCMVCSMQEFDSLIADWMLNEEKGETQETHPWKISLDELTAQTDKVGLIAPALTETSTIF